MPPSLLTQRMAKSAALLPGLVRIARPGLTVLLYHRVGAGDRNIDLPVEAFERQLAYLAEAGSVVSLDNGLAYASTASFQRDRVVLTFDDGTDDFHAHALPLLVRYGLPAVVYVSTGPVHEGLSFPSWRATTEDAGALSWSQIGEAVETGLVTVGSHTHTHADLDRADPATIDDELHRSRDLIEEHTGRPCPHFAYPHAVTSPQAEAAVRRVYSTATVGGWRKNLPGSIDPYRIARVPITRADGPVFFKAKLRGRMSAEASLYRMGGTRRDG